MDITRLIEKFDIIGSELDSILRNDNVDMDLRIKAGRLRFDLIDDYNYSVEIGVPKRDLIALVKEYDLALMRIYNQI